MKRILILLHIVIIVLFPLFTYTDEPKPIGDVDMSNAKLTITSSAFKMGSPIPKKYTGDGPDLSPPLNWEGVPEGTKSLALISDDPDAPVGTWVHWVIFNIPPTEKGLPEGVPKQNTLSNGAKQGTNDFRKIGYNGPAPPPGKPHRYYFKLYALNVVLDLPAGSKKADLLKAMEGHILASSEYMGTYQR
ncbi:MAG TPA: YbhB/YbcL family Raf kinase inhibitor-like protein [Candidatus Hydrogenedens sp.]|nr:YbhB/YbcL family Raf kinase inhibitor-like protein [Candidatus Hydrogenedens sp.]HOK08321.1 YbhB/YbcL family Raf kinase inhibitor-like protein [Candidatus Hydrogenedens sp.]HOL18885.1 YbhB/YbcL family Raf kinase inhibitor-like protein [Candidatus Hydrogenedens sp.]HPP57615.1 YbhB/YbcL family Raf kinase inhibitor-like protein [Candidatus Hydrogenedens sp.]